MMPMQKVLASHEQAMGLDTDSELLYEQYLCLTFSK